MEMLDVLDLMFEQVLAGDLTSLYILLKMYLLVSWSVATPVLIYAIYKRQKIDYVKLGRAMSVHINRQLVKHVFEDMEKDRKGRSDD